MNQIRFTVADCEGTASFVGPCHAIKMLVSACAHGSTTLPDLLAHVRTLDQTYAESVRNGLTIFDEHNLENDSTAIKRLLREESPVNWPPFRVFDDETRAASTQPTGTGLIIFNLIGRRIIQVQNSYSEILRQDRGRYRENGHPTRRLYHYDLPAEWKLAP